MDGEPLTISTSEIHTLTRCKALYAFEYVMGRRPAYSPHDLTWGAAVHKGLEIYYRLLKGNVLPHLAVQTAQEEVLIAGTDAEGRSYVPPTDPYACAALSAILKAYTEFWWNDTTVYKVVSVELPFKMPIRTPKGALVRGQMCPHCDCNGDVINNNHRIKCPACQGTGKLRPQCEGRIDLVVTEQAPDNSTWIVEHKTTSWAANDERYYVGWEIDLQTALYFDAAQELGLNPAGILLNVIRRPLYEEPRPPPKRAPATVPCEAEGCIAGYRSVGIVNPAAVPCAACEGTGRIVKEVAYSNPRFGESPAAYEKRIYQLVTNPETRESWFARRMLTIGPQQTRFAREVVCDAASEIQRRTKLNRWPKVLNRYTCAPPGRVCPWLDVCGGKVEIGSPEFERLYPLKLNPKEKEGV